MLWQIGGHDAHAQIKRIDSDNGTIGRVNLVGELLSNILSTYCIRVSIFFQISIPGRSPSKSLFFPLKAGPCTYQSPNQCAAPKGRLNPFFLVSTTTHFQQWLK